MSPAVAQPVYAAVPANYSQQVQPVIPADPRMRGAVQLAGEPGGRNYAVGKNPAVAFLLSFFLPAIGQIYNGDLKKCFAMWAIYFVSFILAIATAGVGGILSFAVWIWSLIDAYNVASRKSALW